MTAKDRARSAAAFTLGPVWRRLRPRIVTIAEDAARAAADAEGERRTHDVSVVRDEVHALRTHVEHLVGDLHARQADVEDKLRRIAAQVAAADARVADLERPPVDLAADDTGRAEARRLIDEIRTEHGRARSKLSAVAFYEERIARLERDRTG